MQLRAGEQVIRVYYHHYFPFLIKMFKFAIACVPFFFMAYLFSPLFTINQQNLIYFVLSVMALIAFLYMFLIYWLDRLVITNQRIVYIDWKQLFITNETSADIHDVQDILSEEKGIVSSIPFFDYGFIRIQTASHNVAVMFINAPNPDGIKDFIYNVRRQVLLDEEN